MIQLALIQRLYHQLPWISEPLQHPQRFLVHMISAEILRHRAIVRIRQPIIAGFLVGWEFLRLLHFVGLGVLVSEQVL